MENYKGKNYGTAIIKQTVLYPQRSGKITIPSGKLDIVLRVPDRPDREPAYSMISSVRRLI